MFRFDGDPHSRVIFLRIYLETMPHVSFLGKHMLSQPAAEATERESTRRGSHIPQLGGCSRVVSLR